MTEFTATVNVIYEQYITGLKDMSKITDPIARRDQILFLSDIYSQAKELKELEGSKDPQADNKLRLILSRPIREAVLTTTKHAVVHR